MEIRLLGPVELWCNGRLVDVGPPQQRRVLAALAVDAGRPVAVSGLVDRVWEVPPDGARRALHAHVARLRSILAAVDDGSDPQLLRRSGGYVLDVDPDLVDLCRFDVLLAQAREPGCRPERRLDLLGTALGLWRGEPLDGVAGDWSDQVRQRWHQRRVEALVAWSQAEVQCGDPSRAVVALTDVEDRYRLVEPLAGALMRALCAAGRQAEALECYARTRERLAEELGVDPGAELRDLHQAILRGELEQPKPATGAGGQASEARNGVRTGPVQADVSGDSTGRPSIGANGYPVPAQLPPPVAGFAGRGAELGELDALLPGEGEPSAAVVISAIAGTAGIGKTALAVHWAHRVADRFPDGQLYVNLRGFEPARPPMKPAEAVRGLLDALQVPPERIPADLEAQAALYRSLLAGRRILVVLDNARDSDQVRPLLPGSPGCQVVVTSRNRLTSLITAHAARPLILDLLTPAEAEELLARRLGRDRVVAEPAAVGDILEACARLPLALAIVAARAATHPHFPLDALAAELRAAGSGLDAFTGEDPGADARSVFSWSYHQLSPGAAQLFRLLGLHPGPDISAPAAASLLGHPPVRPLLSELCRAHLLTERIPGRYGFHDLLCAYATELTWTYDSDDERHATTHRMLDHYLHTAHTAHRLLNPARDPLTLTPPRPYVKAESPGDYGQAMGWFTAEHHVLLAALDHAAVAGFDAHAWQLAWTLDTFLDRRGHWHDQTAAWTTALDATVRLGDRPARARAHRRLAHADTLLGRADDAHTHLQQALTLHTELGDRIGQGHTHITLGHVSSRQERYADALDHAQQALGLFWAAGHQRGQAAALNNIGWYQANLGHHQQALDSCAQALTLLRELHHRDGEAHAWDSLGYAHHRLGHHPDAINCHQQAAAIYQEIGDRYEEATTLTNLGDSHHTTGDLNAAHDTWLQALAILDDLDHPDAKDVRTKLADLDPPPPGC